MTAIAWISCRSDPPDLQLLSRIRLVHTAFPQVGSATITQTRAAMDTSLANDNEHMNWKQSSISEVQTAVRDGKPTATELAKLCFAEIEARNPVINAYLAVSHERALASSAAVDQLAAQGKPLPSLAGVPIGIKDVLVMKGSPATAGSRILEGYRPPYDATVVKRLEAAGAVLVGKLNCDEFAMGSSNENSGYGPVRNPIALDRVPGGSSGGSAAAVAAGMAVATLGSDTGGSIRQPASFCGVVGLLPTYGRVSRYGLIAFASSLDRVGPLTRSVRDAATMLGVIAGYDPLDSTSAEWPVPDYVRRFGAAGRGLAGGCSGGVFWRRPGRRSAHRGGVCDRTFARGRMCHSTRFAAPHQVRYSDLLPAGDRRGQFQPGQV